MTLLRFDAADKIYRPHPKDRHRTLLRNQHFCALAEIEENAEKFVEIKSNVIRLLDAKEVLLNRQGPASRVLYPSASPNVA